MLYSFILYTNDTKRPLAASSLIGVVRKEAPHHLSFTVEQNGTHVSMYMKFNSLLYTDKNTYNILVIFYDVNNILHFIERRSNVTLDVLGKYTYNVLMIKSTVSSNYLSYRPRNFNLSQ